MKKLLDIPDDTVLKYGQLADKARQSVKAYMEKVLIDHAYRIKLNRNDYPMINKKK